ncbi:glutamate synthase (NADPH) large subunit [Pelagirhabdus alkalitolerans]|uniref:Glutamate synthase (NADPH) large subunit n=1 Tax=Pelagirhabdus alkalitolerans TaxID=1612202 RepID=A0A1G6H6T5_9BACI|nr:glutamate synthase large subunit [Pelagirhabdus alkalitolerans]SDB89989.1 glutamate synthase (NADPH) large subunit [Pelagirhabdus alkalitolerans]
MKFNESVEAQGLYNPQFERDNCGIGLFAHLKGKKTHEIVKKGVEMLINLDHRGGQGSDPEVGDGAGMMVQIPDQFFRKQCQDWTLPKQGDYGVGMVFFSRDDESIDQWETHINQLIADEGQTLIGWRTSPTDIDQIGDKAKASAPYVRQVFIKRDPSLTDDSAFERKLYIIRKQAEKLAKKNDEAFYFPSFSSQTIVYKGLLTPDQVDRFYLDLQDESFRSAFSLVHSRFSTNTFPSWERAHPNRYLIHNGEINTLRGNVNWMRAREKQFLSDVFGDDLNKILPILNDSGSDSSVLDNALEFFILAGYKPAHAAMMLIPEPWEHNPNMNQDKKAFYQYHSAMMEQWDGPTSITFTNGKQIGAILDRNGLRPARYYVTKDDYVVYASESGVIDIDEANVAEKSRLSPGKMLLIDLEKGAIIPDRKIKDEIVNEKPYKSWLENSALFLDRFDRAVNEPLIDQLTERQKALGYTTEDVEKYLKPLVLKEKDPIGAMGNDTPLAVLSQFDQSLFNYFKQLFAQVTNPPIDAYREKLVTSTVTWLGPEGNILNPTEKNSQRIKIDSPILSTDLFDRIKDQKPLNLASTTINSLFTDDLAQALKAMHEEAKEAILKGSSIIILSDRKMDQNHVAMPILLAASSLHQYLVREGLRTKVSLIVDTGEAREVHHLAALIGYGVDAIHPYLVYQTYLNEMLKNQLEMSYTTAINRYIDVATEGVIKVMSKMGISTIQSYRGAQIFEAIGISQHVIDEHFTGTPSQIDGIDLETIAQEAKNRHQKGYQQSAFKALDSGSDFQWRKPGEHHAYNPSTLHKLQWAARRGDYKLFKEFTTEMNQQSLGFLRHLFDFKKQSSIPIEEVESVESIVTRFKTGAMSYGSISQEAHEALAIAMNKLGGKSNSGEGGENPNRYQRDPNGDLRRSAIKQIASARFGVDSHYLNNANELQIKMAQGAKPGEGGHLPGDKVYPWIANVRNSTPGVDLISPPPHHDIYSIEDLAQLIHDLKNANDKARISVKLVAKSGVGTIASGVAKGNADVISVVGYDGGTGASPKTSIKHAGLPWELGLSETHQTLLINDLRERVTLETDGKLLTGKDVIIASLLGAEEYGFATAPLVVLGCVMMRVCHLDTCPVGVATQNPELRQKFIGNPDHVVNFMTFIATEVREILAELGFTSLDEIIGRTDLLEVNEKAENHWKARQLNLSKLLYQPNGKIRLNKVNQNHKLDQSLDMTTLLPKVSDAIKTRKAIRISSEVTNINRVVGTIIGSEITREHGAEGLDEDTITLDLFGSAGQSLAAFIPKGLTVNLTGDANDYAGKGLSGGKLIVKAPEVASFDPSSQVIAGNVCFYGATGGNAFINGLAGERFAVRNSGAQLVTEGVGDHGCEYMTGGAVVVLGKVGKNFAAGMSGGVAYVHFEDMDRIKNKIKEDQVLIESIQTSDDEIKLKHMIEQHFNYTNSTRAQFILENWATERHQFIKVIPKDYKLVTEKIAERLEQGETEEDAKLNVFTLKKENQLNDAPESKALLSK